MSNAAQVREQLLTAFDCGAPVVIADMSATVWCDYVGVDAVVRACQRAAVARAELRVVATAPAVRRLLAAEGLDRLVPVYTSVEAAIAAGEPDGPVDGDAGVVHQDVRPAVPVDHLAQHPAAIVGMADGCWPGHLQGRSAGGLRLSSYFGTSW